MPTGFPAQGMQQRGYLPGGTAGVSLEEASLSWHKEENFSSGLVSKLGNEEGVLRGQ